MSVPTRTAKKDTLDCVCKRLKCCPIMGQVQLPSWQAIEGQIVLEHYWQQLTHACLHKCRDHLHLPLHPVLSPLQSLHDHRRGCSRHAARRQQQWQQP
jgi:hypothetical protein